MVPLDHQCARAGTSSVSMPRQLPRSSADFCWALPDQVAVVTDDKATIELNGKLLGILFLAEGAKRSSGSLRRGAGKGWLRGLDLTES
jgi:hypothetical protein